MREKLLIKLGILMLAVIFLAGMSSYSAPQVKIQAKGGVKGKPEKPGKPGDGGGNSIPELFTVSITMNGGPGFGFEGCVENNFVYATSSYGKYLLALHSDGIQTPGLDGADPEPLTMWVNTGVDNPIVIEGCKFYDGCHGNPPEGSINEQFIGEPGWDPEDYTYQWGYEGLTLRFFKTYDGEGDEPDLHIRWMFDYVPGPKKHGVGWALVHQFGWQGPYVKSSNPNPPVGLQPGDTWETDITGTFQLIHDGIGIGDYDPENNRVLLDNFDIHLLITRIR